MRLISHRGNIYSANAKYENNPTYITETLKCYDCEIDVWLLNKNWFLGHGGPQYSINFDFLLQNSEKLLIHCKNLAALHKCLDKTIHSKVLHCFFHQNDDFSITYPYGYIVSFPRMAVTDKTICMKPELNDLQSIQSAYAVCSDYIAYFDKSL